MDMSNVLISMRTVSSETRRFHRTWSPFTYSSLAIAMGGPNGYHCFYLPGVRRFVATNVPESARPWPVRCPNRAFQNSAPLLWWRCRYRASAGSCVDAPARRVRSAAKRRQIISGTIRYPTSVIDEGGGVTHVSCLFDLPLVMHEQNCLRREKDVDVQPEV